MASKKFLELQEFADADLQNQLKETQTDYQKLVFDNAVQGLDNPSLIKEVRRDIARIKTEIRRRELANADAEVIANRSKIRARRRKK